MAIRIIGTGRLLFDEASNLRFSPQQHQILSWRANAFDRFSMWSLNGYLLRPHILSRVESELSGRRSPLRRTANIRCAAFALFHTITLLSFASQVGDSARENQDFHQSLGSDLADQEENITATPARRHRSDQEIASRSRRTRLRRVERLDLVDLQGHAFRRHHLPGLSPSRP